MQPPCQRPKCLLLQRHTLLMESSKVVSFFEGSSLNSSPEFLARQSRSPTRSTKTRPLSPSHISKTTSLEKVYLEQMQSRWGARDVDLTWAAVAAVNTLPNATAWNTPPPTLRDARMKNRENSTQCGKEARRTLRVCQSDFLIELIPSTRCLYWILSIWRVETQSTSATTYAIVE